MRIQRGFTGAAVLMAGFATMAQADNLVATLNNVSPGVSATISIDGGGSSFGVNGGLFNWTKTGGSYAGVNGDFTTFCIEVTENVAPGNSYTYDIDLVANGPTTAPMGAALADQMAELFGRFYGGLNLGDADQVGGFQLAVWNIVYDGDATILAGNFQASDGVGPMAYADFYLGAIDGTGPRANLDAMLAVGIQDQIVPEPCSLVLLGLGALAIRRR